MDTDALQRMIRCIYAKVAPRAVRRSKVVARLKSHLPHDVIYHSDCFAGLESQMLVCAEPMANAVVMDLSPKSVIDVGCGTGVLLDQLRQKGCKVFGLEYAECALEYCRRRGLDVMKFDLEHDSFTDEATFDVAISMEVGEHLPAHAADRYVNLLASLSPIVVFSAAPPGQGGGDHVNEQPPEYWIAKFNERGYRRDLSLGERWRRIWKSEGVVDWYYNNLLIFRMRK